MFFLNSMKLIALVSISLGLGIAQDAGGLRKKMIADQYQSLQKLVQGDFFGQTITKNNTKRLFNHQKVKTASNANISQSEFIEAVNNCKMSLKRIRAIVRQAELSGASATSYQNLYAQAKSQLQDMYFSSTGIDKIKKCHEIVTQIITLFEQTESLRSYIDQPHSSRFSSARTVAKPLTGEKLPVDIKKKEKEEDVRSVSISQLQHSSNVSKNTDYDAVS